MFNFMMIIFSIIVCFSFMILVDKLFKKEGLMVWISLASVLANVIVCKTFNIFGYTSSLANVLFASTFLASNVISEKYGKQYSKQAVHMSLLSIIGYIICTQIALMYIPDPQDIAHSSMQTLFSFSLRTSIASFVMYYIGNMLNIVVFDKLKTIPKIKNLGLRNFVATVIGNCTENFFFNCLAFLGIFSFSTCISIAVIGSVIEIIIASLSTPFIYITRGKQNGKHFSEI